MSALLDPETFAPAVESDKKFVWRQMMQNHGVEKGEPFVVVRGEGVRVWDAQGREYLDASSGGVWVVNVGYGRTSIADAVRDQLVTLNYYAALQGNAPAALFAEKLIEKMPGLARVYYSSSGSEANEKVFKMVRQISHRHYGGKKSKILFRERDYHGTTFGALAATGQEQRRAQYGPFPEGFVEVPHCLEYRSQFGAVNDYGERAAQAIEDVVLREGPETVGALCLEPITAGGGAIVPPDGYWPRVQEICRKYDILLHLDEVVCGLGRTGKWFGYQHFGVEPDFVVLAKGLASGYAAISCTVTTEKVFKLFDDDSADPMSYFRDASTFGGCLAGPAAALETLRIVESEGLVENAAVMGALMLDKLRALQNGRPQIGDVRGLGLFCGVELVADPVSRTPLDEALVLKIQAECQRRGVIIGRTNRAMNGMNNTLCLSPPLIITAEDVERVVATLGDAIDHVLQ
ncbi:MAG: aminotransferase class III-fold pyridoxal phosphate-dependent enzyme [Pseudomonadota bacterium]